MAAETEQYSVVRAPWPTGLSAQSRHSPSKRHPVVEGRVPPRVLGRVILFLLGNGYENALSSQ